MSADASRRLSRFAADPNRRRRSARAAFADDDDDECERRPTTCARARCASARALEHDGGGSARSSREKARQKTLCFCFIFVVLRARRLSIVGAALARSWILWNSKCEKKRAIVCFVKQPLGEDVFGAQRVRRERTHTLSFELLTVQRSALHDAAIACWLCLRECSPLFLSSLSSLLRGIKNVYDTGDSLMRCLFVVQSFNSNNTNSAPRDGNSLSGWLRPSEIAAVRAPF